MKAISVLILLSLFSLQLEAKSGVSLNEAVNQVKSEGRVLSAKTVNGRHEIKVLTPSGTVKTINKKAGRVNLNPNENKFNRPKSTPIQNRFKEPTQTNRTQNSRDVMKLKEQNARTRQDNKQNRRNVQRSPSKNKKSTNSKNKDN